MFVSYHYLTFASLAFLWCISSSLGEGKQKVFSDLLLSPRLQLYVLVWFCQLMETCSFTELWRGDVTNRMNIGITASGFDQIRLDCGRNDFQVVVETESDFKGVIYTRGILRYQLDSSLKQFKMFPHLLGSFYSRKDPCFLDATGGRRFKLKIPYDQCNVEDVRQHQN